MKVIVLAVSFFCLPLPLSAQEYHGSGCQEVPQEPRLDDRQAIALSNNEIADLAVKVNEFSEAERSGVGVLVLIGPAYFSEGLTPQYAANFIQRKIGEAGIKSLVCYGYIDGNSSVSFATPESGFGPYEPGAALDNIPAVIYRYFEEAKG